MDQHAGGVSNSARAMTTPSTPQSELERIAMEKQASEREQARADALQQYTHTVKKHIYLTT